MASGTLRIVVRLYAKPGKRDELHAVLHGLLAPTRKEAGCIRYEMLENLEDPNEFTFTEEWTDAVALAWAAHALAHVVGDIKAGTALVDHALQLNPNLGVAWQRSGWLRVYAGDCELAIEHLERAMRLSPLDPLMHLAHSATAFAYFLLDNLDDIAASLLVPLQSIAVASIGAVGMTLIIFFLSIYMVIDRDQIMAFLFRVVPPAYAEEARLLQTSVARSFGGFLRGQAIQGVVLGLVAAVGGWLLNIPFWPATAVIVAILQMIPFFGPFVSWAPPVIVAAVTPEAQVLGMLAIMVVGWFVVMNIIQPPMTTATSTATRANTFTGAETLLTLSLSAPAGPR